ncbi:MAG TPA: pyridoxal-phosphate dependent enzyme [Actinobacteria bacterium]|nr:pyridoxal-phosphate dependent enzyme [Actinomycetota bacterium]
MDRLPLARLPTPLEIAERLSEAWGARIRVKRDDLTGFGLSGNKVRKLEHHLAAAVEHGATTVITCGAVQSNHCRATALACARLGLACILVLRTPDGRPPAEVRGNHLLQRLAGAEVRFVDPEGYERRDELMATIAADLGDAWVIPEGASDVVGMQGFVTAAAELADALDGRRATIWHAASSGGTTAGLAVGAARVGLDVDLVACSVGDPAAVLDRRISDLVEASGAEAIPWRVVDAYVGGGYGVADVDQLAVTAEATRLTGLLFDPTYTGKAIYGLHEELRGGRLPPGADVVFWHTGGGFAVFAWDWGT